MAEKENGNVFTVIMALFLTVSLVLTFRMTFQGISSLLVLGQAGSWTIAVLMEFKLFARLLPVLEKAALNSKRLGPKKKTPMLSPDFLKIFGRFESFLRAYLPVSIAGAAAAAVLEIVFSFMPLAGFILCTVPAWILLELFFNGAVGAVSSIQSKETDVFWKLSGKEKEAFPEPPYLLVKQRGKARILRNSVLTLGFYTLFYLPVRFSSEVTSFVSWNEKLSAAFSDSSGMEAEERPGPEKKSFYSDHRFLYYFIPPAAVFLISLILLEFFYRNGLGATSPFAAMVSADLWIFMMYGKNEELFGNFFFSLFSMIAVAAATFTLSNFEGSVNAVSTVVFVEVFFVYELVMAMSKKKRKENDLF